jgi:hypothetical protein
MVKGNYGVLVGEVKGDIATTPLSEVVDHPKKLDPAYLDLAKELD